MRVSRQMVLLAALVALPLLSCASGEEEAVRVEEAEATAETEVASEGELVAGQTGVVFAGEDSVSAGLVMFVVGADGEQTPAVFRGPRKLADVVSGGDFRISEDSLSTRVRVLEEGERIEMAGGGGSEIP